jgi:hypothetical protein
MSTRVRMTSIGKRTLELQRGHNVFVGPSILNGKGVFAAQEFQKGDIICQFVGYPNISKTTKLAQQYMICDHDSTCVIPTNQNGSRLLTTPPDLSGHLINEASHLGDGTHLRPNAMIVASSLIPDHNGLLHWDVICTVPRIKKNEELLICYGNRYMRHGYNVSLHC